MNFNIRFLDNISFTWKLMISYIVILLIPLSVSGVYVYIRSVQSVQDQTKAVYRDMLIQKKIDIEQKITEHEKIARYISINPILVSYFNATDMSDLNKIDISINYVTPFMEWVKNLNQDEYDVRFFTYNTNVFENQWIRYSTEVENESWFKKASGSKQSAPYWEPLHKSRIFGNSLLQQLADNNYKNEISLFIPLMSEYNDRNTSTLIEIYVNPAILFSSLDESILNKNGQIYVLNEKGDIIFPAGKSSSRLSEEAVKWSKHISTASNSGMINLDSITYFINLEPISRLNYRLLGVYPLPSVMKKAREAQIIYIICFSLVSIILFFISLFFTKKLMKKIKQLVKAVREVQRGNLDINVPIKGKDEIAELGQDFNLMINRIKQLIEQVYKTEILQKEAMLESLSNQINPHFIYNSLETIKMMAEVKREKGISDTITSLGSLIRYSLSKGDKMVPLTVELEQVESYCSLQNLMLNNRLCLHMHASEDVKRLRILKLILQPIVENAVRHGFDDYVDQLLIAVVLEKYEDYIKISIKDNGKGMDEERLVGVQNWIYGDSDTSNINLMGSGIGLRNVHRRIYLKYGYPFGIVISSIQGRGTEVIITLPVIRE